MGGDVHDQGDDGFLTVQAHGLRDTHQMADQAVAIVDVAAQRLAGRIVVVLPLQEAAAELVGAGKAQAHQLDRAVEVGMRGGAEGELAHAAVLGIVHGALPSAARPSTAARTTAYGVLNIRS
jgi:hypothetical protein